MCWLKDWIFLTDVLRIISAQICFFNAPRPFKEEFKHCPGIDLSWFGAETLNIYGKKLTEPQSVGVTAQERVRPTFLKQKKDGTRSERDSTPGCAARTSLDRETVQFSDVSEREREPPLWNWRRRLRQKDPRSLEWSDVRPRKDRAGSKHLGDCSAEAEVQMWQDVKF